MILGLTAAKLLLTARSKVIWLLGLKCAKL